MIKVTEFIISNTAEELETLQSLLSTFPQSFNYSIVENDDSTFPFKLLVETTEIPLPPIDEFLEFLAEKVNEVNQLA